MPAFLKRFFVSMIGFSSVSVFADQLESTMEPTFKSPNLVRYVCDGCLTDQGGNPIKICLSLLTITSTDHKKSLVRYFDDASYRAAESCLQLAKTANESLNVSEGND